MTQGRRILVVAQSTSLASMLLTWLGDSQDEIVVANTFAAAKHHLATRPDLFIAEIKLGEYNGLHLALRGRALGIPSIVIGAADETFSRQAEQLGALYLRSKDLMRPSCARPWVTRATPVRGPKSRSSGTTAWWCVPSRLTPASLSPQLDGPFVR